MTNEMFFDEKTISVVKNLDGTVEIFTHGPVGRRLYGPLPRDAGELFLHIAATVLLGETKELFALKDGKVFWFRPALQNWEEVKVRENAKAMLINAAAVPDEAFALVLFVVDEERNMHICTRTAPDAEAMACKDTLPLPANTDAKKIAGLLAYDGSMAVAVLDASGNVWWNLKGNEESSLWFGWEQLCPRDRSLPPVRLRFQEEGGRFKGDLCAFSLLGWDAQGRRYRSALFTPKLVTPPWRLVGTPGMRWHDDFAVGMNKGGRLAVFAINDKNIMHMAQWLEPDSWSPWEKYGFNCQGPPAVGYDKVHGFTVSVIDGGKLWTKSAVPGGVYQSWACWQGTTGLRGPIRMQQHECGRLEYFAISVNGVVYVSWQDDAGKWSSWFPKFSPNTGDAYALTSGLSLSGRIYLFMVTKAGQVWFTRQTSANNGWEPPITMGTVGRNSPLALARNLDGRFEIFAIDDGRLRFCWQAHPDGVDWSGWQELPSPASKCLSLAAACNTKGILELFTVCEKGTLWTVRQPHAGHGLWIGPFPLGENFAGPVQVIPTPWGLHVFAMTQNGDLMHMLHTIPEDDLALAPWEG